MREITIGRKKFFVGGQKNNLGTETSSNTDVVTINYGGNKFTVPRHTSDTELLKLLKIPDSKFLTKQNQSGVSDIISGKVSLNDGDTLSSSSQYTKMDTDYERLDKEIKLLMENFDYDIDNEVKWILIKGYGLPDNFNYEETDIVFNIENYPAVHPAFEPHFVFMREGLKIDGKPFKHYYEGDSSLCQIHFGKKWAAYCVGLIKEWNPKEDNILSYLHTLDVMLANPKAGSVNWENK